MESGRDKRIPKTKSAEGKMKTTIILLAWIWCLLKFLIAGAFLQKWKMQAIFNYTNISRIAPDYEVNLAGCYFLAGIVGLFIILVVKRESESDY